MKYKNFVLVWQFSYTIKRDFIFEKWGIFFFFFLKLLSLNEYSQYLPDSLIASSFRSYTWIYKDWSLMPPLVSLMVHSSLLSNLSFYTRYSFVQSPHSYNLAFFNNFSLKTSIKWIFNTTFLFSCAVFFYFSFSLLYSLFYFLTIFTVVLLIFNCLIR